MDINFIKNCFYDFGLYFAKGYQNLPSRTDVDNYARKVCPKLIEKPGFRYWMYESAVKGARNFIQHGVI